jgi:hypothetical protein
MIFEFGVMMMGCAVVLLSFGFRLQGYRLKFDGEKEGYVYSSILTFKTEAEQRFYTENN